MAATLISTIIADARIELKETVADYWTDAELLRHFQMGAADLWGMIVDLNQEHYMTVDTTNVSLAADSDSLTGVPSDCFRVLGIEPRDTTSAGASQDILFYPRNYFSAEFRNARQLSSQDPTVGLSIFYDIKDAGSPVSAPTVLTAPRISSAALLRFIYIPGPGVASLTTGSNNPIPGESDHALMCWIVAHARAKERDDRMPDPNWLAMYSTDKESMRVRLAPRQTQEPEVVEDLFSGYL